MQTLLLILSVLNLALTFYLLFTLQQIKKQPDISQTLSAQRQELTLTLNTFGTSLESRLNHLTDSVEKRLEIMRATVDEKLQTSLERRLNESFKQVSERLEAVYKGLGEMQTLAHGVGDLKRVLTNVKTRGTWGEVQLEQLLDQILNQNQYQKNVITKKGSTQRVEFALLIPSKGDDDRFLQLPVDAKFPVEDYLRIQEASEQSDPEALALARKNLELRVKKSAQDINQKYLDPPQTTDFAIMYLPTEGLYAEVTQNLSLCESLQRDLHIAVMGPNTIVPFLNSLQLGFRTLAIEKHSAQVWELLGQIKNEFGKFGDILAKTQKKLAEASNIINEAQSKTTTINRRLAKIETQPRLTDAEHS